MTLAPTSVKFQTFDPLTAERRSWDAYHVFRREVAAELRPGDPVFSDNEVEIEFRRPDPLWASRRWIGWAGEKIVGEMRVGFREPGSPFALDYAPFMGGGATVLAAWRHHGIATSLLRRTHVLMQELNKSVLTMSSHTDAGHAFMLGLGAEEKHRSVENRACFADLDWPRLRTWENAPETLGLRWEHFAGRVPDAVLEALLPELTRLVADIPLGGLQHAPIRYEMGDYRSWYQTMDRSGGAHHIVLLRGPDGDVAGICEAGWDSRTPDRAWQQLTAVSRNWRGHGLAKALKAAMLRQMHEHHPNVALMVTHNAEVNAPILSINRRVGFVVHRCNVDYQITRTSLDTWAAGLLAR